METKFTAKNYLKFGLRMIQTLATASIVTGFIWASSDYLILTVLVDAPVTPLSVLLMLYGLIGMLIPEGVIRVLNRKKA